MEEARLSRRSILAGLAGTILFHLLFFYAIPNSYLDLNLQDAEDPAEEFDIQLMDPEEPEEKPEPRFVETNQQAPANPPDETENFAARDQQAANEKLPEKLSDDGTPARDGEEETPFDKIFSGDLTPPEPSAPPAPEQPEMPEVTQPSQPEQRDPLAGFEEDQGKTDDGIGTSVAEPSEKPEPDTKEKVEGQKEPSRDTELPVFTSPLVAQRPSPAPRPRLPRATPGPVRRQEAGTSRTGIIGVDAKFSDYGDYLERMVEAVSQRWTTLCASRSYSESSVHVTIEFTITKEGMIRNMETVENTSQALGVLLARSSIEQGQPYGEWTAEMVEVLGVSQSITFSFHYW